MTKVKYVHETSHTNTCDTLTRATQTLVTYTQRDTRTRVTHTRVTHTHDTRVTHTHVHDTNTRVTQAHTHAHTRRSPHPTQPMRFAPKHTLAHSLANIKWTHAFSAHGSRVSAIFDCFTNSATRGSQNSNSVRHSAPVNLIRCD